MRSIVSDVTQLLTNRLLIILHVVSIVEAGIESQEQVRRSNCVHRDFVITVW